MNYPSYNPYGFNPGFGAQGRPGAFSAPLGYPGPQMAPAAPPAPAQAQTAGGFMVQPVTGREEALAVIADPLSAGVLMPDLGHGVIYLKRFNTQTGASDFGEFAFVQPRQEGAAQNSEAYVPLTTFNSTVEQLRTEIAAARRAGGKTGKGGAEE